MIKLFGLAGTGLVKEGKRAVVKGDSSRLTGAGLVGGEGLPVEYLAVDGALEIHRQARWHSTKLNSP